MSKILKPYTIVPSELYVQRDADRQIESIIEDMGRPGYVLVSRQMGKTNLLLNAKRRLERSNDVFIYVDLSNPFSEARSCFESIIDTALETYPEKFHDLAIRIADKRKELVNTPPHKQHTSELRQLLQSISGKLVVILDEIDALTKTAYSDEIFAQIRSIYFSRVNFKELENLTYILSGVVEPTEIIKDPKISPFNIGQKIFLNDFNRTEFDQFLNKSKLNISQDVQDRIFYWTNGNPRMTWDICSAVETQNTSGEVQTTPDNVDKIVLDLYLTKFDNPPIDNIRQLVKKDREIRNAIVEVEYKKGKEVPDRIKSKLYLSGIINYNENDIHIKNEIIKECLSITWIKSIEEEDKGLVRMAIDNYENGNYGESLKLFERYISQNEFEKGDSALCYYYMGYAAHRNSSFEKAIEYLDKANFDIEEDAKWHYRVLNLKGLSFYYADKIEESLKCLREVIDSGRKDEIYARSLLNYGIIALKSEVANYSHEAVSIFKDVIEDAVFDSKKINENVLKELKSIAHYNLAEVLNSDSNVSAALENYEKAIELGSASTKPHLMLALLKVTTDNDVKYKLLDEIIELIEKGKIELSEKDPEKPIGFSQDVLKNIIVVSFLNFRDSLYERLKPHFSLLGEKPYAQHLYDLAIHALVDNKDREAAISLLKDIHVNFNSEEYAVSKEFRYFTLKLLSYLLLNRQGSYVYCVEYIYLFSEERVEAVDYVDMEIFANLIYYFIDKKELGTALEYVNLINSLRPTVPKKIIINYLVIYNFELNLYILLNQKAKAVAKAREIIAFANDNMIKQQNSNLLGDTGLETVRKNAESVLEDIEDRQTTIRIAKKYGRNETVIVRYKDGTTVKSKFKKIENDLGKGECFIVS